MCSCPPTSSETGHTNGVQFHAQSGLCSSTPLEDGLFIGYWMGSPSGYKAIPPSPFSHFMLLPAFTNATSNCLSRPTWAPSANGGEAWRVLRLGNDTVSATSEAIPLEISYGVVKWELWNFTVCIRVEGSSQSIVSPGLQIPARPQSPFHLRKVLLDNTGGMPVQWDLQLQGPAP